MLVPAKLRKKGRRIRREPKEHGDGWAAQPVTVPPVRRKALPSKRTRRKEKEGRRKRKGRGKEKGKGEITGTGQSGGAEGDR